MLPSIENDNYFLKLINKEIKVTNDGHAFDLIKNVELGTQPGSKSTGYHLIGYKGKTIVMHRLVWLAYNGEIPYKYVINHLDGNKLNNDISNLECVTYSENSKHSIKNGLQITTEYTKFIISKKTQGCQNHNALCDEDTVRKIREDYKKYPRSYAQMGRDFNLPRTTISSIVKNQSYRNVL